MEAISKRKWTRKRGDEMTDELTELDKQVALAMGWKIHEVDPLPPSWHNKEDVMVCFTHEWQPTTNPVDWHTVSLWMVANFTDTQKLRFCREYAFLIMEANGKPLGALYDLFEAVTAPLPMRCKAFLAVMKTTVSEEE